MTDDDAYEAYRERERQLPYLPGDPGDGRREIPRPSGRPTKPEPEEAPCQKQQQKGP